MNFISLRVHPCGRARRLFISSVAAAALTITASAADAADGSWTGMNNGLPQLAYPSAVTADFDVAPSDPNVMYTVVVAETGDGTIYRTTDGGANWSSRATLPYVNALSVDPTAPGTVWVGYRDGLSRSTDGAATFAPRSNGISDPVYDPVTPPVRLVEISSVNPQLMIAGGSAGRVWRSVNAGQSWSDITSGLTAGTPFSTTIARQVRFHPTAANTVFYGGDLLNGGRSLDGGVTWSSLGAPRSNQDQLELSRSNPQVLFATGSGFGFLYRTGDGGTNWSEVTYPFPDPGQSLGDQISTLALHPGNSDILYAAGGTTPGEQVRMTTNGAASWRSVATGLPPGDLVYKIAFKPGTPSTVFALTNTGIYTATGLDAAQPAPPPVDADADGVPDTTDSCPSVPGPVPNGGCPAVAPADSDRDGVPDSSDRCPSVAAALPSGCPAIVPPRVVGISSTRTSVKTSLRIGGAGRVVVQLVKGGRTVARSSVRVGRAQVLRLSLRPARSLGRGTYRLVVRFTPSGGAAALTTVKVLRIR